MEDKFKILRNAELFVVNRQYDRAVTEYQKIVETLGEDPSVLNTLGDLLLKTGRREEALETFRRVAEIFTQSGFVSKAIAIYRKVDQLGPGNLQVVRKLAELYTRRGLSSESVRYWRKLGRLLEDTNDAEALVTVWRRVLELQPQDVEAHSRLAEALSASDPDEASNEWLAAAKLLFAEGDFGPAREAAEHALTLNAANMDARELIADVNEKLPPEPQQAGTEEGTAAIPQTVAPEEPPLPDPEPSEAAGTAVSSNQTPTAGEPAADLTEDSEAETGPESRSWTDQLVVSQDTPDVDRQESATFDLETESRHHGEWEEDDAAAFFGTEPEEPVKVEADGENEKGGGDESPKDLPSSDPAFFDMSDAGPVTNPPPPEPPSGDGAKPSAGERSLESSLEEIDFYLKLDLRSDAVRVLEELLVRYPDDERVRNRARKAGLSVGAEETVAEDAPAAFESNVESALEDLFFEDSDLNETNQTRVADLESRSEIQRDDPRSQYDLGVAYREMGMFEDAAAKFERAYQLFSDAESPEQALLCSSMLTSTYLRLHRFDKSVEWADIGLSLPRLEGDERKALEYDRAVALEQIGEAEESLNGFRRLLEFDPDFRDVRERVARMVHEPE